MKWIKKLFRIQSPIDKKRSEHAKLLEQAFIAQRKGDLRKSGLLTEKAQILEREIMEMTEQGNHENR
jgi:hypothetical protein